MNNKPRVLLATFAATLFVAVTVAGCAFMKGPPTAVERKFFDFQTNQVPTLVSLTNTVTQTNHVTVTTTNELDQIVPKVIEQIVLVPHVVESTNYHEEIKFIPKDSTKEVAGTIGGIAGIFNPVAAPVVTALVGGVFGLWARMRSHRKTSGVLAQDIDAIREFLWTIPGGDKYDEAIKMFLRSHQKEEGVVKNVVSLLKNTVDDTESKGQLVEIQNILASLGVTPPKPPA